MDKALIRTLGAIAVELKNIRRILAAEKAPAKIVFDKDGIKYSIDDLETFFERMEDDRK